ncbi:MAG TPA: tetratricopeptide repeat protein [Chryseosolibacter sp.]
MPPQLSTLALLLVASLSLTAQTIPENSKAQKQDAIVDKYLKNGAWKFHMYSEEWQRHIDLGLKEDSTIAYLWQQKAMPLYKQKRYQEGLPFLNKAVRYNRTAYLPYRGFMKCIFSKDYTGAIEDFSACIQEFGNSYVMDHSYRFYSALAYLQLKEFSKAEALLKIDTEEVSKSRGETWVHHLDVLYLGIAQLELANFHDAIRTFDKALKLYPQFSEAHYYKSLAQKATGDRNHSATRQLARKFFDEGHTINEDNAIYEKYPYQPTAASFNAP